MSYLYILEEIIEGAKKKASYHNLDTLKHLLSLAEDSREKATYMIAISIVEGRKNIIN